MSKKWFLQKIPKKIHLFWDGKPLSFLNYLTFLSLRKLNPDWEIYLHSCKNYESCNYFAEFVKLNIAFVSHKQNSSFYIRFSVLHEYGGIWSDNDIIFTKSFEDSSINDQQYYKKDMGIVVDDVDHAFPLSFMIGCKNNILYKRMLDRFDVDLDNADIFKNILKKEFWNVDFFYIPYEKYAPANIYNIENLLDDYLDLPNDSFGVKWHQHNILGSIFNESCSDKNIWFAQNTISALAYVFLDYPKKDLSFIFYPENNYAWITESLHHISQKNLENCDMIVLDSRKQLKQICNFYKNLPIRYFQIENDESGTLMKSKKRKSLKEIIEQNPNLNIGKNYMLVNYDTPVRFLGDTGWGE